MLKGLTLKEARGSLLLFGFHRGNFVESKIQEFVALDSLDVQCFVSQNGHFNRGLSPIHSMVVVSRATRLDLALVETIQDSIHDGALGLQLDAHQAGRHGIGNVFKMRSLMALDKSNEKKGNQNDKI